VEKNNINIFTVIIIALLLIFTGGICFIIGKSYQRVNGRVGSEFEYARNINRELTDEQRSTAEINRRAIDTVERLRGINQETDSAFRELRELNRRSISIPDLVRAEADLLENYYRDTSNVISDHFDNLDNE